MTCMLTKRYQNVVCEGKRERVCRFNNYMNVNAILIDKNYQHLRLV